MLYCPKCNCIQIHTKEAESKRVSMDEFFSKVGLCKRVIELECDECGYKKVRENKEEREEEELIYQEERAILRKMATDSLKVKGKL